MDSRRFTRLTNRTGRPVSIRPIGGRAPICRPLGNSDSPQLHVGAAARRKRDSAALGTADAAARGLQVRIDCHTIKIVGIIAYLEAGGTKDNARATAAHRSLCTTKRCDHTGNEITLDGFERITIWTLPLSTDRRHARRAYTRPSRCSSSSEAHTRWPSWAIHPSGPSRFSLPAEHTRVRTLQPLRPGEVDQFRPPKSPLIQLGYLS